MFVVNTTSQDVSSLEKPGSSSEAGGHAEKLNSEARERPDQTIQRLINEFPAVFDEACTPMVGQPVRIEVELDARPTRAACRNVPEPLMPALAKELKKLESQGIIERTDKGWYQLAASNSCRTQERWWNSSLR